MNSASATKIKLALTLGILALAGIGCAGKAAWRELRPGIEIETREALPPEASAAGGDRRELRLGDGTVVHFDVFPNVENADARRRISGKRDAIRGLYQKRVEPYYGTADGGEYCDPARLPAEKFEGGAKETRLALGLWATENFVYGVCEPEAIRYKSQLVLLHCPGAENVYAEVRFFYAKEKSWEEKILARCRPSGP